MPARIRKKGRKGKPKSEQHLELVGLGLLALGVFLASILYVGWSGGMIGGGIAWEGRAGESRRGRLGPGDVLGPML